jgi:hypothetical protein
MGLSLRQAADMCGKGRSTLHRALQSGKMSGTKGDNGEWSIDGAELARAFPWDTSGHDKRDTKGHQVPTPKNNDATEIEIRMLREMLDREREAVEDLRERLTRAELLLTDKRPKPRSWWPW